MFEFTTRESVVYTGTTTLVYAIYASMLGGFSVTLQQVAPSIVSYKEPEISSTFRINE